MIRGVGPSELTCGGTGPTEHDDVGVGTLAPSCVAQDSRSPLGRVPHGRRRQAGGLLAVAFDRRGNEHTRCREPDVTLTSGTPTGWSFCRDERARRRAAQIRCFENLPAQRSARTHRLGLADAGTANHQLPVVELNCPDPRCSRAAPYPRTTCDQVSRFYRQPPVQCRRVELRYSI
jgi:hypothetical protein